MARDWRLEARDRQINRQDAKDVKGAKEKNNR